MSECQAVLIFQQLRTIPGLVIPPPKAIPLLAYSLSAHRFIHLFTCSTLTKSRGGRKELKDGERELEN